MSVIDRILEIMAFPWKELEGFEETTPRQTAVEILDKMCTSLVDEKEEAYLYQFSQIICNGRFQGLSPSPVN